MTEDIRQYPAYAPEEGALFEHAGHHFMITARRRDDDAGTPWDNSDGHGPVSAWVTRDKRPGERILSEDRGSRRYYDMREAQQIAERDQWGYTGPTDVHGPLNGPLTRAQKAVLAAQQDFEYLRAWCNDEWEYQYLSVVPLNSDGEPRKKYRRSLYGIESNSPDAYFWEVAYELADDALTELRANEPPPPPPYESINTQLLDIATELRAWYDDNHGTTGPHAGSLFDATQTWGQVLTAALSRVAPAPNPQIGTPIWIVITAEPDAEIIGCYTSCTAAVAKQRQSPRYHLTAAFLDRQEGA